MRVLSSSLLIADLVQDLGAGQKKTIIGIAGGVRVQALPATAAGLWFYWRAYLQDPEKTHEFTVQIRRNERTTPLTTGLLAINLNQNNLRIPGTSPDGGSIEVFSPIVLQLTEYGHHLIEATIDGVVASAVVFEVGQ